MDSIAEFKTELRKRKDISQVPTHYEIGPRKLNIILAMLRCFASFLNYDSLQVNTRISGEDVCDCSLGELLDNKKPFGPLYIFKHVLKNNLVLFI
jgi:hypothetical protein